MREFLFLTFGFCAGFSIMGVIRAGIVERLQRDNALLEKSRNFWLDQSLISPAQQVDSIQRTLDAIEQQIIGDSGDVA